MIGLRGTYSSVDDAFDMILRRRTSDVPSLRAVLCVPTAASVRF